MENFSKYDIEWNFVHGDECLSIRTLIIYAPFNNISEYRDSFDMLELRLLANDSKVSLTFGVFHYNMIQDRLGKFLLEDLYYSRAAIKELLYQGSDLKCMRWSLTRNHNSQFVREYLNPYYRWVTGND